MSDQKIGSFALARLPGAATFSLTVASPQIRAESHRGPKIASSVVEHKGCDRRNGDSDDEAAGLYGCKFDEVK